MIKIGFSANGTEEKFIKSTFKRYIHRYHKDAELRHYENEFLCYNALETGKEINTVAVCLEYLPTTLPEGLVIAALSKRSACHISLLTFPATSFNDALFNLPTHPVIASSADIISEQFKEIIPTAQFVKKISSGEVYAHLDSLISAEIKTSALENLNGGLIPQMYLSGNIRLDNEELEAVTFDPSEITALPGSGVVAFLCKPDDLETRRFLKEIHSSEIGEVINIERKLKKLFNDKDIAAFCEKDADENYHLYAAAIGNNIVKRCRVSQSTFFELAETAFKKLND